MRLQNYLLHVHINYLSSPPLSEHRLELSRSGTMSILLSIRYTVVPLFAASRSKAIPGRMKCDTSAMCTPTCQHKIIKFWVHALYIVYLGLWTIDINLSLGKDSQNGLKHGLYQGLPSHGKIKSNYETHWIPQKKKIGVRPRCTRNSRSERLEGLRWVMRGTALNLALIKYVLLQ